MSLAEDVANIAAEKQMETESPSAQLKMVDAIEDALKNIGISLETRFEIPFSSRISSTPRG